jgi:NADH-quinone oxidoreductase subunit J
MVAGAFFYMFAAVTVISAFMVVTARNPVHSVLFLILAFFYSAGIFIMLGAEFLAMVLVVVYVGAVAVLFLFVVMMIDVDFAELRAEFIRYMPVGALIGIVLLVELVVIFSGYVQSQHVVAPAAAIPDDLHNTEALGMLLFRDYLYFLEAAGLILLVAMVGAIVLTLRHHGGVRRQDVGEQVGRTPESSVEIRQVESGKGI